MQEFIYDLTAVVDLRVYVARFFLLISWNVETLKSQTPCFNEGVIAC